MPPAVVVAGPVGVVSEPKNVYWLLWELIKHVLHRRGRDELFIAATSSEGWTATAAVTDFRWESDADAFCTIDADAEVELVLDEDSPAIPGRLS